MVTLQQPLPTGGPMREEDARTEMGRTSVSPLTARLLLACFLVGIVSVPSVEWAAMRAGGARGIATAWSQLFNLPGEIRSQLVAAATTPDPGLWQLVTWANRTLLNGFVTFERALEDEALIARSLRPRTQAVLTKWLGVGNERVYRGREGWLFYRPDVEYVTGPGFLDRRQMSRRVTAAPQWTPPPRPDPRAAIVQFWSDLSALGITLVVMPTPVKPSVHPEKLVRRGADATDVLRNASYAAFVDDLRREGVLVFDPSAVLAAARQSGPQFLATDTHWRPEAMELVAELLGGFLARHVVLPATDDPGYRIQRLEVRNTGDVARMLDLPDDASLFPAEAVWLRRVLQADGAPWRSSAGADVLLLGDSFTNIYALESMGWGTSAGLAEQLSYVLRRPVDRLVQNDAAAYATREMLQRDPGRLNRKRVVVYQFAERELAFGDWKMLR